MKVFCWGTRGNVATPGKETIEVGGNTSCYELRFEDGSNLLVDCGSGAIEYASSVMARASSDGRTAVPLEHHLLISHLHWDHILGFPFFHPIHTPGVRIHVYSAFPTDVLARHMEGLFDGTYSPLRTIENLAAEVHFHAVPEDGMQIGAATVRRAPVDHTTECFAFRIEHGGRAFGYANDHEARDTAENDAVVELVRGVDLLLHDAQYTAEEYARHIGWGHSSIEAAVANARRAGARRLLLGHHDPKYTDRFLNAYVAQAQTAAIDAPPFELAREGQLYSTE